MYYKTRLILIFLIFSVFSLNSEGKRDAGVIQRNYAFSDFNSLSINGNFRILVIKSDEWDIHITSERDDLNFVKLRKYQSVFEMTMKEGRNRAAQSPVVVISMPDLVGIDISGLVQMEVGGFSSSADLVINQEAGSFLNLNGFECSKAEFNVNGPSKLHAFLSADNINILSKGSTDIRMGGRAQNLYIKSEGRSKIDGSLLLVDNVDLELTGVSEIRITPDIQMNIKSTDKAMIYYNDAYMDADPVNEGNAILRNY